MSTIYIFIITGLLISNIIVVYLLIVQKKYTQILFMRAWALERKLIHIYHRSPEDIQQEIDHTINNIKPLP